MFGNMNNQRSPFGRSSPRRRPGSAATSDSRSESRLSSATPLHSHASWEESQQSLELFGDTTSEDRHYRPSSRRDDRKPFDATTPTLIDEEDYPDDFQCQADNMQRLDDTAHRRTPGASMYRSVLEEQLRRTPGAEPMHQASALSESTQEPNMEAGLGFGLTLSTPVAAKIDPQSRTQTSTTWDALGTPKTTRLSSPTRQSPQQPFDSHMTSKARAPRNFSPDGRGAFSPALLRLTEDIGNLLNDDEDDEYTVDIPVFKTDNTGTVVAGMHGDWAGAFAVDNKTLARQTTAEGDIVVSTKARRKVGDVFIANTKQQQQQQQQLRHRNTQQPIPRRGSNEVFEFGAARNDGRAPQLLNFGGAFAPPAKESSVPFSRPFAFAHSTTTVAEKRAISTLHNQQYPVVTSQQTRQQHASIMTSRPDQQHAFDNAVIDPNAPSQSFDTFSTTTRETPIDVYFRPNHLSSPSPIPSPAQPFPQSDMVATAQEYIPMSAQRLTPQYPQQMWSGPSPMTSIPAPAQYDPSLHQHHNWHPSPPGFGSVYSSSFGDTRLNMTPSPHMPVFRERDPSIYPTGMQSLHQPYVAPIPTHQHADFSQDQRGTSARKDGKRGKRGKKKDRKDKGMVSKQQSMKASKNSGPLEAGLPDYHTVKPREEGKSGCADPVDSRRAELDESPAVRLAFKNFYKAYRAEEQKSVSQAEEFARNALHDESLPSSIHWRVYIELADLARRTNRFSEARRHYQKVCSLQPYASQGWVEYSKLEEECGNMNRVTNIMYAGLEYCEYNESLMIRAIKHQEKMGKHSNVRALLARLKHVGIDKVWRTVLEGALFEARVGNITTARRALKYVMHYVPWYGPLYVDFYRLERDHGHTLDALDVVERGLSQIPRYSPLWFCALRVCEELDQNNLDLDLPRTIAMLQRANVHVSKEVIWKIYLEAAFLFERAAVEDSERRGLPLDSFLSGARHYFALTIQTCRLNLRWKVWLAGARMELSAGNESKATRLFARAHEVAPEKVRSLTLLDYARLHEYIGERDVARAILCKGRTEYGHDWKVWLESVLLEMRGLNFIQAFQLAASALALHGGTGRLWSALVQLSQHVGGVETQYIAFRKALNAVPKSGEVWCEGARIHFNPFSDVFDVDRARRHLLFAGRFTPQYGDSFLESVRVELVRQWLVPIADYIWETTRSSFVARDSQGQNDGITKYITDVSLALSFAHQPPGRAKSSIAHSDIIEPVRERLSVTLSPDAFDLSAIILACSNADPNYGPLWFYCRRVHSDSPRKVIEHAATVMLSELRTFAHIYLAAQVRRQAILSTINNESEKSHSMGADSLELWDSAAMENEGLNDRLLRSYPSLLEIYNPLDPMTGVALMECTIDGCDFATGLMEFNKNLPLDQMSSSERRRAIFATDALFP